MTGVDVGFDAASNDLVAATPPAGSSGPRSAPSRRGRLRAPARARARSARAGKPASSGSSWLATQNASSLRAASTTRATEGMYASSICPVRVRDVVARHTENRRLQVEQRLLGEDRRQLGRVAARPRRLLHEDDAAGLRSRGEQRFLVERLQRAQVEHLDRGVELVGRALAERHHRAVGDERHVAPLAREPRLPERDDVLAVRHLAALGPVDELRLEDHDRIGVADRGREQPLRVRGRRRDRDLDPGRVDVVGLGRVVVQLGRAHAAAVGHPDRDRERHRPARAPAVAADVGDQLVEAGIRERVVLHLADGPEARHAEPDRRAEDPGLGERRVDAAVGAEAVAQARSRAEDAAGAADVLAQHQHVRVALHLDVQGVVDRLDEQQLTHRGSSAARRDRARTTRAGRRARARRRAPTSAGGSASAAAIPARIASAASALISSLERVAEHPEPAEVALVAAEALVRALLLDSLEIDVRLRIVRRRVRRGAVGDRLDERRPLARARRARPPRASPRRPRARRRRRRGSPGSRSRRPCRRAPRRASGRTSGVEIAHWLLLQRRTSGARITAAKLAPSWNAPSEVAPSPKNVSAQARLASQPLAPGEPGRVRHLRRDRDADRGEVVVGRVPPAGRMAAPPGEDRRRRHPAQQPDRRLAVAGKIQSSSSSAWTAPAWIASWPQ